MQKSAFGLFFSFLIGCLLASHALAADSSDTPVVKKHHSKKHKKTRASVSHERIVTRVALHGKRRSVYQHASYSPSVPPSAGELAGLNMAHDPLALKSNVAYVMDSASSEVLFEKNADTALPIASITKLMTALVVVESNQDMNEVLEVTKDDIDRIKNTSSRLRIGARLTRANMLHIALMSSENRAASALGRNYPGGLPAFVAAMNAKAKELGMNDTHYVDSNGLSSENVASARDLAKLILAAQRYPILCQYSTDQQYVVEPGGRALEYRNSNHLVNNPTWDIMLQKTGYIVEAGRCLVMQAKIEGRAIIMVLLDSKSKESRLADAGRVRKWVETVKFDKPPVNVTQAAQS
jgi:D-alanyl-D-alanine endopeptidase (penicillin-binding protein 7)